MRRWSWRIGTLAGIPVYVHATFFLIFAWVALQTGTQDGWGNLAGSLFFVAALFGCVVLHELGHALAARRYGIATRDITLLPIGGLARLERMPKEPRHELVVALAGPAVNVVIAAGLLLVLGSIPTLDQLPARVRPQLFLQQLMVVNIFLVVFNLLPAFPMDGGRVLRALLATRLSYPKATRVAATVGQVMAFFFFLTGLWGSQPILMLIAVFVWFGASQEAGAVETTSALAGLPVRAGMLTEFHTLAPDAPLGQGVSHILRGSQQDFPVVEQGRLVGLLTRQDLIQGLSRGGAESPVHGAMSPDVSTGHPDEPLEDALRRLQGSSRGTLPVLQDGHLVGLLTLENISELLMIRSALDRSKDPA